MTLFGLGYLVGHEQACQESHHHIADDFAPQFEADQIGHLMEPVPPKKELHKLASLS